MYGTELHAEQKPVEEKILQDFGCTKFIYCSDAGLGSEKIKKLNHADEGKRKDKDEDSFRAGGVPGAGQCIHTQQDR